jgi:hypothetical protein
LILFFNFGGADEDDGDVVAGAVTDVLPDGTLSSPIELQIVSNNLVAYNVLITRA